MSSIELDVQAASAAGVGFESFEEKEESKATHFNKSIFAPPFYPVQFSNKSALHYQTRESQKADALMKDRLSPGNKQAITEGNSASASTNKDSEGNSSTRFEYESTQQTDSGATWSAGGYVQSSTNKDGESKTEAGGKVTINW